MQNISGTSGFTIPATLKLRAKVRDGHEVLSLGGESLKGKSKIYEPHPQKTEATKKY